MLRTLVASFAVTLALTSSTVRVPFVACNSDGQGGPQAGPKDRGQAPSLPTSVAASLAYYASANSAVLAPRGWHCFGLYGSSGTTLIVTPEVHSAKDLLSANPVSLSGPAVELNVSLGSTSGRFKVAQVAARLFPAQKAFVERVIGEGVEPASDFPFGPYAGDVIKRINNNTVEFETPGGRSGMGTNSMLAKNSSPISGLAMMTKQDDLVLLAVRVPANLRAVVPSIVNQAQRSTP